MREGSVQRLGLVMTLELRRARPFRHRCEWQCRESCRFCHWPIKNDPPLRGEGGPVLNKGVGLQSDRHCPQLCCEKL